MKKILFYLLSLITILLLTGFSSWFFINKYQIKNTDQKQESQTDDNLTVNEIYQSEQTVCEVSFVLPQLATATPTVSPTATATVRPTATPTIIPTATPTTRPTSTATVRPTATPTVTPTPQPECYQSCFQSINGDDNCPSNLVCKSVNGEYICVNNTCPQNQTCTCSATPTPTATASPTPNPTPTPTPQPGCYDSCSSDSDCPNDLLCRSVNNVNKCLDINCPSESDCTCNTTTPKEPELPKAGGIPPTIIFALGGIIIVLLGLVF